jgi:hypothetical protein
MQQSVQSQCSIRGVTQIDGDWLRSRRGGHLFARGAVSARPGQSSNGGETYDLALIFLLLRLRRRTRFFLHFALILTIRGQYEARCVAVEGTYK